jgi:hypothetical protein
MAKEHTMRHALSNARRNAIPYLALLLVLAVGVGGGYAFAASKNKSITVCADKKTGILHLKTRGRCKSSQTLVTWNQQGPTGPQGAQGAQGVAGAQGSQGPAGAQGAAGVSVWANVESNGTAFASQGLSVQRVSMGTYQVTITAPGCASGFNAPTVSVSDSGPSGGSFPVAWYGSTGTNEQFMVYTGVVSSGVAFTSTDLPFDVLDGCS